MTEYVEHRIYFELSLDVSINVLYKIALEFERSPGTIVIVTPNGIGFILRLMEDEAKYLHEQYGRYIDTICDFDQKQGGSFI